MSRARFLGAVDTDGVAISKMRESEWLWTLLKPSAFKDAFRLYGSCGSRLVYKDCERAVALLLVFREKLRRVFNLIDKDSSNTVQKTEIIDALQDNFEVVRMLKSYARLTPLLQIEAWEGMLSTVQTSEVDSIAFEEFFAFCTFGDNSLLVSEVSQKGRKTVVTPSGGGDVELSKVSFVPNCLYYYCVPLIRLLHSIFECATPCPRHCFRSSPASFFLFPCAI